MPLNFPSSPSTNTTYSFNNRTWTYNGNAWALSIGGSLNTSVVPEGSNLYFSNARVYSNVTQLGYITSSSLSGYATNTQLGSYATNAQLTSYATTANSLSQFASTTSVQLATLISDETGSGNLVFATSPTLVTPNLGTPSAVVLTNASGTANNLTANIANFINVTDDTTTNATRYPIFANGTSGVISEQISSTKLFFNPSTGLLTSTDYNSSSDERLKENIKTVENAVDTISSLRGVTFDWKEGNAKGIGLIAQEVNDVLPDVVTTDENGYMGVKYTNIIGILVEAIKEQQEQINTLKKQIEKL